MLQHEKMACVLLSEVTFVPMKFSTSGFGDMLTKVHLFHPADVWCLS